MFTLPKLPYAYDALEPFIDAETMKLHHDKHHLTYVDKLNAALEGHKNLEGKSVSELLSNIEGIPSEIRQAVINHGGGHANHMLFWTTLGPSGQAEPEGDLADAIKRDFGSFADFKKGLTEKATNVFGSGWAFLVIDNSGKLSLKRQSFQNSPIMHGFTPLFGIDVWEHAYYLKYQNRRAEYIEAIWNVINWDNVSQILAKAK